MTLRSSHRRYSVKKGALKNFSIFTRKQLRWCLFLIKLHAWYWLSVCLRSKWLLVRISSLSHVFFCEICEILKNTYSYRTPPVASYWTLLKVKVKVNVVPVGGELFSTKKYSHFKSLKNIGVYRLRIFLGYRMHTELYRLPHGLQKKKKFSKKFKGVKDFQS